MFPVLVCAVAVAALLAANFVQSRAGTAAAKLVASSSFVWAAISWGAAESTYGIWMLSGLLLCWLGDALLLSSGQSKVFLAGIGAFLLGHVAYVVACLELGFEPLWLVGCSIVVAGLGAKVASWLWPDVPPDFRPAVVSYVAVIGVMLAVAAAAAFSGGPALLGIGAFGFAASDVSVARDRFVTPAFINGAWGLPAYFASQLALAYSVTQVAAG